MYLQEPCADALPEVILQLLRPRSWCPVEISKVQVMEARLLVRTWLVDAAPEIV